MKNFLTIIVFVTLTVSNATAFAGKLMVGLSPLTPVEESKRQINAILTFLADTTPPGGSVQFFDAYHLTSLGTFTVPAKKVYRHPKAKLSANKKLIVSLLKFAKQRKGIDGRYVPPVSEMIRLPQFLRFVSQYVSGSARTDVLILGSPLYADLKDPTFSMANGRVPGDGHLQASRSDTPFGLKESGKALAGVRVHLGFADDSRIKTDAHAFHVRRFWSLYISKLGGSLVTFTRDLPTLFERVKMKSPVLQETYSLQPTEKLEMIRMRPPELITRLPIQQRRLSREPMSPSRLRHAANVEIGISWNCADCDLDLYSRPQSKAQTLSFKNTQSAEGTYYKDFTSSPRLTNGLETIAYHRSVDLRHMFIAVNFFGGKAPDGVSGEVRIAIGQHTYGMPFHIAAAHGNAGGGRQGVLENASTSTPHWIVIDPLEVLGIQETRAITTGS